jgi:hypothetical protein
MDGLTFFDVHTHAFPDRLAPLATRNLGNFYNFPVLGKGTASDLASSCAANGISGALILCTVTNPKHVRAVNEASLGFVRELAGAGIESYVFSGWHQDCTDPEGEVEFALNNGIRGFKIHPDIQGCDIDDERFFPLYRLCEGVLPVYFHMGDGRPQYRFSEARKLVRVAERFPKLRIGAAHLGGYNAWEDAHLLTSLPDVWFDTSSTIFFVGVERASELVHMLGPERCMFGTDYPVVTAAEELPRFMALDLTPDERRALASGNARRFLRLGS